MAVFTFIAKEEDGAWSARAYSKEGGYNDALSADGATAYELERKLVRLAWDHTPGGGGVQTSFNMVTPHSAVVVVSVGSAVGGVAVPSAAAAGAAAPAAKPEEARKEEPSEEEEGPLFSLFD